MGVQMVVWIQRLESKPNLGADPFQLFVRFPVTGNSADIKIFFSAAHKEEDMTRTAMAALSI